MKIVLIEDDQPLAETLIALLEALGHEVTWLEDMPQAEAAWSGQTGVELVISDVNVRGALSFDFLIEHVLMNCKILVITANTQIRLPAELEAVAMVFKPLSRHDLVEGISLAVSGQR